MLKRFDLTRGRHTGPLNADETGQGDNFYPYEETRVEYLFVTEKYLTAPGREKFVNVARNTMHVSHSEFASRWRFN